MKWLDITPNEKRAVAWAFVYIFVLFVAYYCLRPIRDELGAAGGGRELPWLFLGTLLAMLALTPLYGYLVKYWTRATFIAIGYRFFMGNLLLFALLMYAAAGEVLLWTGRAFFIWLSVFNLFVVSVFWSLMTDVFDREQGKRLFAFLATGATLGGIAGSALVSQLAQHLSPYVWLLLAVLLLEIAVFTAGQIATEQGGQKEEPIGGGILSGLKHTVQSPYLLGICAFIMLYSFSSTILYFQQAEIVNANISDRGERTAFFAHIDLWVNSLTLLCQLFLTGKILQRFGMLPVLMILPLLSAAGFGLLASYPLIGVFVWVQVARRVANFAFTRPSREILFTRLPREDRYKAKNVIDTVVYRSGDQVGSWGYSGLSALGLSLSAISWLAVPLCLLWAYLAVWLVKREQRI